MSSDSYARSCTDDELKELEDAVEVLERFRNTSHRHRRALKSYRRLKDETKSLELSRRHWVHEVAELNRKLVPLRAEVATSRELGGELKEHLRHLRSDVTHLKDMNRELSKVMAHFYRDREEEVAALRTAVAKASEALGSEKLSPIP
jgi:chromosome segregation ATPase